MAGDQFRRCQRLDRRVRLELPTSRFGLFFDFFLRSMSFNINPGNWTSARKQPLFDISRF